MKIEWHTGKEKKERKRYRDRSTAQPEEVPADLLLPGGLCSVREDAGQDVECPTSPHWHYITKNCKNPANFSFLTLFFVFFPRSPSTFCIFPPLPDRFFRARARPLQNAQVTYRLGQI